MKLWQSKINQSTKKRGNTRNKMEGPMSKKTKESLKRVNRKGNIKFSNFLLWEGYLIRKGEDLLKGPLAKKNPCWPRKGKLGRPWTVFGKFFEFFKKQLPVPVLWICFRIKEPPVLILWKKLKKKEPMVLVISKPLKNRRFSWKDQQRTDDFVASSLTF
jgi:hypothetical protein